MNVEKRVEYEEKTRQRWESRGKQELGWSELEEVLVKTVEEVCALSSKGMTNPWTMEREREERLMKESNGSRRKRGGGMRR